RADGAALGAEVVSPVPAPFAAAARRVVRLGDDPRTEPLLRNARPELRDDAGDLVAHRHRRSAPELVVEDVEVGAAHSGAVDGDGALARRGGALLPVGEPDVARPRSELRDRLHASEVDVRSGMTSVTSPKAGRDPAPMPISPEYGWSATKSQSI